MIALLQDAAAAAEPVQSAASGQWPLWGDTSLANPLFLALAPLALALLCWGRGRRGRAAGLVPVLPGTRPPRSLRQRLGWLPAALQAVALLAVVVALARPLRGNVLHESTSEGVDIALVIDRSGSMRFDDLEQGRSRLEVVVDVVGDFATRRMTDRVGAADNVALFSFARYPQLLCPFTLDVNAITGFLDGLEIVKFREEDGTAIGAALAKAVAVLEETDARSKVVVLLTDGQNNVDDIAPLEAARLAAEQGTRVYTVLAGRYQYTQDLLGRVRATAYQLDTTELEAIAEQTGGRFYRAEDRQRLEEIYAEIEELERTPRTEQRFVETFDLYVWPLGLGLACYALAWLLGSTWLRRLA